MIKRVLVPLAVGFEEMEAVILIDVLRRAGVEVEVLGLADGPCVGSRGVVLVPDGSLDDADVARFDLIALPGGGPGTDRLRADPRVRRLLLAFAAAGKVTAAVCAAPTVLMDAGLLKDRRATSHPAVRAELGTAGVEVVEDRVVQDGTVVTSQSPGTSFEFAYYLVDLLCGDGSSDSLNEGIFANV